jgi:O-antigen/teichoic acid export membrane protein
MRQPGEPPDTPGRDPNLDQPASSGARTFASNAFWMLLSDLFSKVASFVLVVIIARGLGAEEYGYFNFAVSFVPIFLFLGTLGVDVEVFRAIARDRHRLSRVFASGFVLRLAFGSLALVLAAAIGAVVLDGGDALRALVVVSLALFLDELSRFAGTVFKAFERMRFHAVVVLVNRLLSTALAGAALAAGGGLELISGAYLLGSIGALGFAWFALRRFFPPIHLRDADRAEMKNIVKNGVHIGVASTVNMLTFRLDAVLLQVMRGPIAVAMYGIAYRFFESFLFVSWSLSNVVLPRIARSDGGRDATQPYQMALALAMAVYLPIAIGSLFAADWVVTTVFSERYEAAADAVKWLTGALVLYGVAYLARTATIALGKRNGIAQIATVGLVANIVMNLILIPRYGFEGAAAATFATEVLDAVLLSIFFVRAAGGFKVEGFVLTPVFAAALMALVLWLADVDGGAVLLVGTAVYGVALVLGASLLAPAETRRVLRSFRRPVAPAGAPIDS